MEIAFALNVLQVSPDGRSITKVGELRGTVVLEGGPEGRVDDGEDTLTGTEVAISLVLLLTAALLLRGLARGQDERGHECAGVDEEERADREHVKRRHRNRGDPVDAGLVPAAVREKWSSHR